MTITQTVIIPADSNNITLEIPRGIPPGPAILSFTPAKALKKRKDPVSIEEALQIAEAISVNPNRKKISRHFGKHKGIFGGDGIAYQRAIRNEWE